MNKFELLIIEDSEPIANIYENVYRNLWDEKGFDSGNVIVVKSIKEYKKLEKKNFDIALVDWNLEDGNSSEILEDVRKISNCVKIISGFPKHIQTNNDYKKLIEGVDIICKPISYDNLVEIFENYIAE